MGSKIGWSATDDAADLVSPSPAAPGTPRSDRSMPSSELAGGQWPEQLVLRDLSTDLPADGLDEPALPRIKTRAPVHKLQFNLGVLGPRLRAYAEQQRTSMAVLVRRAILNVLDAEVGPPEAAGAFEPFEHSVHNAHFHLNLPVPYAAELTARARAADMTRGEFVWSLMRGVSPPALPPDHVTALESLRRSTDCLAAMSTDLGEFLRVLVRARTGAEEPNVIATVQSLNSLVRGHLKIASVLIEELKPYRRARW